MSSTTTQADLARDQVVHDFVARHAGRLSEAQLNEGARKLAAATGYAANGSVASLIFYLSFQVTVTSQPSHVFNGKAGGVSTPGGGALFGTVYTDDLNALFQRTAGFHFQGTSVYLAIEFFDANNNYLGTFQSGAISTVNGVGGGSGSWS